MMTAPPARPAIELAALDMAGTTIEEGGAVYEALASAVAATGHPAGTEAMQRWMGADKREAISGLITESSGTPPAGDTVEELYAEFRALLQAAYIANPPSPIVGVPEAIAALRASGVMVARTTGFSRDIAEPLLKGLGWTVGAGSTNTIDAVVCADDVAAGRPAPYMIFRAMEATGVLDVARVAVVGDTVVDLRGRHQRRRPHRRRRRDRKAHPRRPRARAAHSPAGQRGRPARSDRGARRNGSLGRSERGEDVARVECAVVHPGAAARRATEH